MAKFKCKVGKYNVVIGKEIFINKPHRQKVVISDNDDHSVWIDLKDAKEVAEAILAAVASEGG